VAAAAAFRGPGGWLTQSGTQLRSVAAPVLASFGSSVAPVVFLVSCLSRLG
jgi:hypothetical protein